MVNQIQELARRAMKQERLILGLMSGTSLDGLDLALCKISGYGTATKIEVVQFETVAYGDDFKSQIRRVFAKREVVLQEVCLLNETIALTHATYINEVLERWGVRNQEVDFIASHGQTIFHAPKILHKIPEMPNGTLQIGDGDHIAVKTGIITISDFRQKHIAAGGEGAPLALYGDYLVFSEPNEDRILLNIGGISNFTFLPGDLDTNRMFSTDVGPGNTLMDQFVQHHFKIHYDQNGDRASRGTVNQQLLEVLLSDQFFTAAFPKTTGPELFNLAYLHEAQLSSDTIHLDAYDLLATLSAFTAQAIIRAVQQVSAPYPKIYVSGGGMHNTHLLAQLESGLPGIEIFSTAELGFNPDAKEAMLFALLANETVAGFPLDFGSKKGIPSVCMGKISLPF